MTPCSWTSARSNGGSRSPAASSASSNIPYPDGRRALDPVEAASPGVAGERGGDAPGPVGRALRPPVPAGSAGNLDVFRLGSLLALGDVELDLLPLLQAAVTATSDRAEVHEHIRTAFNRDEAVALVAVEPLHSALRHLDLLVVHAAP